MPIQTIQTLRTLCHDLQSHLLDLERRFLADFLPADPLVPPSEYEHPVSAYCVLAHAALEEYFEKVAITVMDKSLDRWLMQRTVTDTLLTLVAAYDLKLDIDPDDNVPDTLVFDGLRTLLFDQIKDRFSRDVNNNNGASIKHARQLLMPVAIDISQDSILRNSLSQLVKARHSYAHHGTARLVTAPEDAKQFVEDCAFFCEDICAKAVAKFEVAAEKEFLVRLGRGGHRRGAATFFAHKHAIRASKGTGRKRQRHSANPLPSIIGLLVGGG